MPLGRSGLFTTFLFLLGSTVRPQQKGGEARLLLFRLFLFSLAALEFFSGGSDICLSADRLPWGSLGSEFGDPPGSPWVWRHSVWQAGPPKTVKNVIKSTPPQKNNTFYKTTSEIFHSKRFSFSILLVYTKKRFGIYQNTAC